MTKRLGTTYRTLVRIIQADGSKVLHIRPGKHLLIILLWSSSLIKYSVQLVLTICSSQLTKFCKAGRWIWNFYFDHCCTIPKRNDLFPILSSIGFWWTNWGTDLDWLTDMYDKSHSIWFNLKCISIIYGLKFWLPRFNLKSLGESPWLAQLKGHFQMQYIIKTDLFNDTWRKWNRNKTVLRLCNYL